MTVETLGRAFGLYRRTAISRSMVALLIANAIPLVGVAFFGWSLITILVLYWVENGIVGFWNVPKIALAQGSIIPTPLPDMPESAALAATGSPSAAASLREAWREAQAAQASMVAQRGSALRTLPGAGRIGLALFFVMHYGTFWFVHGIFVFALPTFGGLGTGSGVGNGVGNGFGNSGCLEDTLPSGLDPSVLPGFESCVASPFGEIVWASVAIAAIALFISHGASFLYNYVAHREYRRASPTRQMGGAYGRVVVLHMTILLGAFAIALIGAPIGALIVLVVLKTAFDLSLHMREHGRAAAAIRATG
jgi:hypothetical protein